jgi:hypothetical protein
LIPIDLESDKIESFFDKTCNPKTTCQLLGKDVEWIIEIWQIKQLQIAN